MKQSIGMKRISKSPYNLWSVVLLLSICLISALSRAAEVPAASPAEQKKEVVEIPLAEIAPRGDQVMRRLEEIEKSLQADEVVIRIEQDLSRVSNRIEAWLPLNLLRIDRVTSVIELNEVGLGWQKFTNQLVGFQNQLEQPSQRVGSLQQEVDSHLAAWKTAQSAAARKALPQRARLA